MRIDGFPVFTLLRTLVLVAVPLLMSSPVEAQHTVDLLAAPTTTTVTLPNGTTVAVPMWGYALDGGVIGVLDGTDVVTVPGPRITVPAGSTTLTVNLTNLLTVPTSLVIPGQPFDASNVVRQGGRVISMTAEAAAGGSATYTFDNLKPGTFLYQSGTHQAVQVQMGLYGAMTRNVVDPVAEVPATGSTAAVPAVPGLAYAGIAFDNEVVLLYSEIDIALHEAVATGTYGTPAGPTSTIDYTPSLYLINGASYANDLVTPPAAGGIAGQRTLLRILNAGLKSHAPTLVNGTFEVVAEDGNAYPFARSQAALLLAAGKTHDARWTPTAPGVYSVYDRLLGLNAAGKGPAGMLAKLKVASPADLPTDPPGAPTAVTDGFYGTSEDLTLPPGVSVLANDLGSPTAAALVTGPTAGNLTFVANGTFAYTPAANFSGVDSFTYTASNAAGTSAPATVLITVSGLPDAPTAAPQSVGVTTGETVPISLQGSDPDGDVLTFYATSLPANGTLSIVDAISQVATPLGAAHLFGGATPTAIPSATLLYAAASPGPKTFGFVAKDAAIASAPATVDITVHASEAAVACGACEPVAITVTGTDGSAVTAFRWTVEEDRTFEVIPGNLDLARTPSVNFHRSYMPVVQSGVAPAMPSLDPAKRHFVSVLPEDGGYSNGGARIAEGDSAVEVTVDVGKVPTAQIRVRVFLDNAPLNGAIDGVEAGLAGFAVMLEDAGGRYGMSAAQQLMDAFGNPLGTKYQACSTGPGTCESYEVQSYGNGFVLTDAAGYALFENLVPGKYGANVIPPAGHAWQQTSTIEGKKAIDAWVKAKEPTFFTEFGPAGPHAVIGFTQAKLNSTPPVLGVGAGPFSTVAGQVTNLHLARPPDPRMYSGAPFDFSRPWVALNTGIGTAGSLLYAQPTDEEGNFSIAGVPSGSYTLVVFDSALNIIIANKVLNVTGGTNLALGSVPVFQWFSRLYNYVFEDDSLNPNGFRDAGEPGIPEQAVNIRWRDGSMYQSAPTDGTGFVPFEEVFPFFNWLVAEVDYTRFRATGVTVVVDNGGDPATAGSWRTQVGLGADDIGAADLVPQPQSDNGGAPFRTETGPVLLQGFQSFLGQSNVLLWGKTPYAPPASVVTDVNVSPFDDFPGVGDTDANGNGAFDGDHFHGGVSGIVHYSTTRAENDPRWGGAEVWEPGIPGVRVQLWDATRTRLLNEVTTDSWDESLPTGCPGPVFTYQGQPTDCYDGLRNFNQVRPSVFDGGYAFLSQVEPITVTPTATWLTPVADRDNAAFREVPLPAGKYVVKVIVPGGYQIVGEEDKNVDFGLEFIPQQFLLTGYALGDGGPSDPAAAPLVENTPLAAPFCVGNLHEVPQDLTLFPGVASTYGGTMRPACDEKLVTLRNGQNPGANFFLFTEAPVAAHITGFVLDDTANEFDPNSPQFGEKYAPPFMPVAIRDWKGREITRTFTDAYGRYNALIPSTFTANVPAPSGMSPSMLSACVNAPTLADGTPDPHFNPKYSHFCYTLQYMPGTTTYLDTPVLPTGAFAGADQFPVDVHFPNQTPVIAKVTQAPSNPLSGPFPGPYIVDCVTPTGIGTQTTPAAVCGTAALRTGARTIVVTSAGSVQVPNPYYDGLGGTQPKVVTRDHGFGPSSTGGVVRVNGTVVNVPAAGWTNGAITVTIPSGIRSGQLRVDRCLAGTPSACTDWRESVLGVTLTVAKPSMHTARPPVVVPAGGSIQAAIDAPSTLPGALVLVRPGNYEEMVVMTKPVRLQGGGAAVTRINVVQSPAENLQAWRDLVGGVLATDANRTSYLLPDQLNMLGAPPFADGILAATLGGEGAGVTVFGRNFPAGNVAVPIGNLNGYCGPPLAQLPVNITGAALTLARLLPDFGLSSAAGGPAVNAERYCLQNENYVSSVLARGLPINAELWKPNARIDGFSIHGSSNAAGIMVNGNARYLEIANDKIFNNASLYAGGIRVGHPGAQLPLADDDANNRNVAIHNNQVTENGGIDGLIGLSAGGGIVIGTGTPNYVVQNNWVAGNFAAGPGAGISHNGLSVNGVIDRNTVVFNESFNQGQTVSGGGISIAGRPPEAGELTPGSGSVRVSNNLIQGNQAASGDGGGISLASVNGEDVASADIVDYQVVLYNNVIVNNEAALAGGGIAIQDAVNVQIIHNTIAHNDSLATAGGAFTGPVVNQSAPQPAGIVARGHSPNLAALTAVDFSNPALLNSIVWHNRSFYYGLVAGGVQVPGDPNAAPARYGLIAAPLTGPGSAGRVGCTVPTYTAPSSVTSAPWSCLDLGVLGAPAGSALNPLSSVLTTLTRTIGGSYSGTNVTTAPSFVSSYANGARNQTISALESTTILVPAAFDEGGNFIRPLFGPLTLAQPSGTFYGNRHLTAGVNGLNLNTAFGGAANVPGTLLFDLDGETRPSTTPDRGADERAAAAPPTTPVPTHR